MGSKRMCGRGACLYRLIVLSSCCLCTLIVQPNNCSAHSFFRRFVGVVRVFTRHGPEDEGRVVGRVRVAEVRAHDFVFFDTVYFCILFKQDLFVSMLRFVVVNIVKHKYVHQIHGSA